MSESNWKDWATNGRTSSDLIHPSGGQDDIAYQLSGMKDAAMLSGYVNGRTLEYGCGNGRILRHLRDYGVWGVDLVADFIKDAKRDAIHNVFTLEDFPDMKFDTIYSLTVFIHLSDKQTEDALIWIRDHLREDGVAWLQIPIYDKQTDWNGNFMNVRTWTVSNLESLFDKVGLELKEFQKSPDVFRYEAIGEHHESLHLVTLK